jgi:hypothetical protein
LIRGVGGRPIVGRAEDLIGARGRPGGRVDAAATSLGYDGRIEPFAFELKFAGRGYDQILTAELLFESAGALGGVNAYDVLVIEAQGKVGANFRDGDRRGDDKRRKNADRSSVIGVNAETAEIQCQGKSAAGLKNGEFGGAANVDRGATNEKHFSAAGVNGDHAAAGNKEASGSFDRGGENAAFDSDIFTGDFTDGFSGQAVLRGER